MGTKPDNEPDRRALTRELSRLVDIELGEGLSEAELESALAARLNTLIQTDFSRLISLLYRIDVSEDKLKKCLKENPGIDAGLIMTRLIIERQWQKIRTRKGL